MIQYNRPASLCVLLLLGLATAPAAADRPRVYAIEGATVVAEPGDLEEPATIIVRDGLIVAVGSNVDIPSDAEVIDGEGRWVYPGLIDAWSELGVSSSGERSSAGASANAGSPGGGRGSGPPAGAVHPIARIKPEKQIRDRLVPFSGDGLKSMEKVRDLGFTTTLAVPGDGILRGSSTAILLRGDSTVAEMIVRDGVAQHAAFNRGGFGQGYPTSLMGAVAALRQAFLDSSRYAVWKERYESDPSGMPRPEMHASFEALSAVIDARQPIIFHTDSAQDTLLAHRLALEFGLELIVAGSGQEWEMADRIAATGVPLILSCGFPDKPKVKEAEEALNISRREMRRYLDAPAGPARLHEKGVRFAFTLHGLKNHADLPKNMRKMMEEGLPEEVALAAWTTVPAELLGLERVLGTLAPGKIANLLVTDGPLFAEETKVRRVFVDGIDHEIEVKEKPKGNPDAVVDPRGEWSVTFEFGSRSIQRSWTIEGEKDNYSGTGETRSGTVTFDSVELAGDVMTVTFPAQGQRGSTEITVIVSGDSFEGTTEMGPRTATVRGTRTSGPDGGVR